MKSLQSLQNVLISAFPASEIMSIALNCAEQLVSIDTLQNAFDAMHKDTSERITLALQKHINSHSRRTNIFQPNSPSYILSLFNADKTKAISSTIAGFGPGEYLRYTVTVI